MRHPVSIVLVVVLALSLPVSAVGTTATVGTASVADDPDERTFQFQNPSVTVRGDHAQLDGTPNRLVLEGDGESVLITPTPDFGFTVASQDNSIHTDYQSYAFENSFEDLENDTRRSKAVISELERIEDRMTTLRERERETAAAHAAGEITDEELARMIARNYYEAKELEESLERLRDQAEDVNGIEEALSEYHESEESPIPLTQKTHLDYTTELEVHTTSIRTEIALAVHGEDVEETLRTVSIESSQQGLVLSAIDDGEYIREATRYDNRDLDQPDQVQSMDTAQNIAEDLYPWTFGSTSSKSNINHDLVKLWGVQASFYQGQLTVLVDGGTGSIYHERQTLELDSLPIETTDSMSNENVTATLEQTAGIVPAKITVTDQNETPIEATIVVDGTTVGETDDDGELWFVPPTDGYELTVRTESESLNATVGMDR